MEDSKHTDRQVQIHETDDPLEDLYEDAEAAREQFSSAQKQLRKIKETLREHVDALESEGLIDVSDAEQLHDLVDRGEYGRVRETIREARQPLEFDDEEKDRFAERFGEAFDELVEDVEAVRNAILEIERGIDRDDMVDLLYGKYSTLNKRDIEATFEAIDDVSRTSLSPTQLARVLQAYDSSLNVRPTADVLEAVKKESER